MANKQVSELTAAGDLTGTELVHVVQGGNSRRTTAQAIADLAATVDPGDFDPAGTAAAAIATHEAAGDPHPGYVTTAEQTTALGSYLTTAAAASGYQPLDSDLTAIAALTTTAYGRGLLELANQAALQSAVGITQYTDEMARDALGTALVGSGVGVSVNDAGDQITLSVEAPPTGGGAIANGLVSGGQVVYETGLTFRVSAATYYINGARYTAAEQTVTLSAADATHPRIDVLALDTTGDFVVVAGTAAANPSQPDVDPSTQLYLTFVLVPAGATSISGVTAVDVYKENVEWTATTSGTGFNANSTTNPYAGTKDIEGTNVANNAYVLLDRGATADLSDYTTLSLFLRSKATWAANNVLRAQWFSEGVARGTPVTIASGYWGFDSSITASYQLVAIPMAQFAIPAGTLVDQLRITKVGTTNIGFYIDNIVLQANGTSVGQPAGGLTQAQADARYLQIADANETARDAIGTALVAGTGVTITPNDGNNTITIAASGGGQLGPAWTDLTFGSTSTLYGIATSYAAGQTFAGAAGKRVEIEAYVYKVVDTDGAFGIGDGTNGVYIKSQGDNNVVMYRYSSSTETSITATNAAAPWDYTGVIHILLTLDIHSSGSTRLVAVVNGQKIPTAATSYSMMDMTTFSLATTLTPFVKTGDISKCYARARLIG